MKLTCDLCGSELQMNTDRQGALCTGCGMNYSMDSLRQKLNSPSQAQVQTGAAVSAYAQSEPATFQAPIQELIIRRKFDLQAIRYVVTIVVDGEEVAIFGPKGGEVSIPVSRGDHDVYAIVKRDNKVVDSVLDTFHIHVGDHNWCGEFRVRRTAWNALWELSLGEDINDTTRT